MRTPESIHLALMSQPAGFDQVLDLDMGGCLGPETRTSIIDGHLMAVDPDNYNGPVVDVTGKEYRCWSAWGLCLVVVWRSDPDF